ncbi:hypothetical protein QEJ31_06520 [Pigmentibacter sp. JX0631]|uniref:hypothetical protein n=1 Tax=Pigmentibacter sp. JX0631 TaxID=2976982 RepID=UPI0024688042|nr:hypothetical protein [Pigmentibacter sp. JX0631]WGL61244.1 hypothetical protein QEJ31_06520 [Pigmentibacter sp. JX0631]
MKLKAILTIISFFLPLSAQICSYASEKILENKSNEKDMNNDNYTINEKDLLKKFNKGESFVQGGIKYTVYPELIANYRKNKLKNGNAIENDKSEFVLETKNFSIHKTTQDKNAKNLGYTNQVVYNNSNENFGILSGVIIVKTKNNLEFTDKSFEIIKRYPNIGYYLVKIPKNLTISRSLSILQKLNYVSEASVEVIENFQETL